MKYKNDDDNRYRVKFMRSTEEIMDTMTVNEFISYLEGNAELEDDADYEHIDGKTVKCKAYDLKEADSNLHKEFLVTADGRLFYWLSLISKIELVDRKETTEEKKDLQKQDFRTFKSTVKEVVAEMRAEDTKWSWRADVLKNEIRVWWGYLQYCDNEDSHFTIKMSDRPEESNTDNFVVARNEHGEYMCGAILGGKDWEDGTLDKCVEQLLRSIARIAHSRY